MEYFLMFCVTETIFQSTIQTDKSLSPVLNELTWPVPSLSGKCSGSQEITCGCCSDLHV